MTLARTFCRVGVAALIGLVLSLAFTPARADLLWRWTYAGAGIDAGGTFATTDTTDTAGFYEILAIDGSRNGIAITGLAPAGTAIPGNEPFAVDNLIRIDGPGQLTVEGFGYALASGAFANPYFADFLSPAAYSEVLTLGASFSEVPIVFTAMRIPEPSMLALAVGAVWVATRRRHNGVSCAASAA